MSGFRIFLFSLILTVAFLQGIVFAVQDSFDFKLGSSSGKILTIKLKKTSSIADLIRTSGYSIDDDNVYNFLADFIRLNPNIKSMSSISKGTMVRVPLKHLDKTATAFNASRQKAELTAVKRRFLKKKEYAQLQSNVKPIDKKILLKNIRDLFSFLGDDVTLETEGFRYFPLSEKSDFTFDTGVFPVIDLHDNRILVVDLSGNFPDEIRNLLEISWPEYRLVSISPKADFKTITESLLTESGYQIDKDAKIVSGERSQIEYHSDYVVQSRRGNNMNADISFVSIIAENESLSPPQLLSWFKDRDVRIFEISLQNIAYAFSTPAVLTDLTDMYGDRFIEKLTALSGYPFTTHEKIDMPFRDGIRYHLNADLVIDLGYRKKIVQFSDVSDYEASYARKLGLDIIKIEPWDDKKNITKKIMSLLSLSYSDSPKINSLYISPKNVRYRLFLPGFTVRTFKGSMFITDTEIDPKLLQTVIREGISIVRF